MDADEITGRFLPSRVYIRWKWAVRAGLMVVPMLVLLGGGLVLFLTASRYRSTALVEIENARSPQESAKMLKSSAVLDRAVSELELVDRLRTDRETTAETLAGNVRVKVIPDTRLIEISVTLTQKDLARDIAASLPRNLVRFEADRVRAEHEAKAMKLSELTRDAEDLFSENAAALNRIGKIHGQALPDSPAFRELERVRQAYQAAEAEVERRRGLRDAEETAMVHAEPRLIVHTEPVISDSPSNPKIGPELDELLLHALAAGLIAALLLPYLFELVFPAYKASQMPSDVIYDL